VCVERLALEVQVVFLLEEQDLDLDLWDEVEVVHGVDAELVSLADEHEVLIGTSVTVLTT
jgi:hypothetical protein